MSTVLSPVFYQAGIGGIGGFLAGFTSKKLSKLVTIIIGLFTIFLLYLGAKGIISINYEELWVSLAGLLNYAGQLITFTVSVLPFMGSFSAGFLLGFKFG